MSSPIRNTNSFWIAILALIHCSRLSTGFSSFRPIHQHTCSHHCISRFQADKLPLTQLWADKNKDNGGGGPLGFLFNPYESKIPDELKDEIYAAEANTPAAKERNVRVASYAAIAFVGIVLAFFSAFITELRNSPLPPDVAADADPLAIAGFSWVQSNFVTNFLFTNKLGGGLCLILGAGAGLLAEAELDTKRINAEKIFAEMERRREAKETGGGGGAGNKRSRKGSSKKKRRSGKEKKRLEALSEVVVNEKTSTTVTDTINEETAAVAINAATTVETTSKKDYKGKSEEKDDGILGKIKGFYDRADSLAASQALLLNKKLEEEGLIDKITDETGLKVIGREEAAKLQEKDKKDSSKGTTTKK